MNLSVLGNASHNSLSILPVMLKESKVRKATLTPSKAPDLHSAMKAVRLVALGVRTVAMDAIWDHAVCALGKGGVSLACLRLEM